MRTDSQPLNKLQAQFQQLLSAAGEASAQLERGQSETPVSAAFQQLLPTEADQPLRVSVVCCDSTARSRAARWLDVSDPAETELTTQLLHNDAWQTVQVTFAGSLDQLQGQPQLYQQFCSQGHLLIVVAAADYQINERAESVLANITESFEVVWPTVVAVQVDLAADAWCHNPIFRAHAQPLEPYFLLPEANASGGDVMSKAANPLRQSLLFERRARALSGAVGNLSERQQRELIALQTRRQLLGEPIKSPGNRNGFVDEKAIAQAREQFAEQISAIEKQINLKSERATQPLGMLTNLMRENSSALSIDDLDKQVSPALLRLSVNGSHLAAVNRTIEHALRQGLTNDVTTVQDRLQQMAQQASTSMSQALGGPVYLSTAPLMEAHIWRTVENLLAIGKESHIELARKGVFDMLTAGRQKVFILIMFVSLMGRMGLPNLFQTGLARTGFGLFMASVLIGSMVNAIFVWRREKESQSQKELSKIKDTLFNDGTKVIEQVEKGKLNFIREYLRDVTKDFEKQLKQTVEEQGTHRKLEAELESKRQDAARKKIDGQIKTLRGLDRQIARFATDARSLAASAKSHVREAARAHLTLSTDTTTEPSAA
ncbi:MAG: hypothetical protein ACR2NM_15730, partial [Bythopirellula sp.]